MPTHNQDAAALANPAVTPAEQASAKTPSAYSPDLSGHLPPLDGIRGLAILLVLLCHYVTVFWKPEFQAAVGMSEPVKVLYHLLSCGWIGVDLFFVLSGFLITGSAKCHQHKTIAITQVALLLYFCNLALLHPLLRC